MVVPTAEKNDSSVKDLVPKKTHADINRTKLTNAAFKIISTQGMEHLTIRNICDLAGLTTGSFYHLYSSKDELVRNYLKYFFNNYKEELADTVKELDAVEQTLGIYKAYVRCCEEVGVEFISYFYSQMDNPMLDFRHRGPEDAITMEAIGEYMRKGQESGFIRKDIDLDEVFLSVGSITTGVIYYWCIFKGDIDLWPSIERLMRPYLEKLKA